MAPDDERIADGSGEASSVDPNTMHPLLRAPEACPVLSARSDHPEERRSRRSDRLTDAGRGERDRLMTEVEPRGRRVAAAVEAIRHALGEGR